MSIIYTLEHKVPLNKMEKESIELVTAITDYFSPPIQPFNKQEEVSQANPIYLNSINFLWKCLEEKSSVAMPLLVPFLCTLEHSQLLDSASSQNQRLFFTNYLKDH
jgi:hypothetical protein